MRFKLCTIYDGRLLERRNTAVYGSTATNLTFLHHLTDCGDWPRAGKGTVYTWRTALSLIGLLCFCLLYYLVYCQCSELHKLLVTSNPLSQNKRLSCRSTLHWPLNKWIICIWTIGCVRKRCYFSVHNVDMGQRSLHVIGSDTIW